MSQETKKQVQETILKLETGISNQNELDRLWGHVKSLMLNDLGSLSIYQHLTPRKIINSFKKPTLLAPKFRYSLEGCL